MKTTKDVRKEINEATKTMRETARVVNEALCHAAGKLDKVDNDSFEAGRKAGFDEGAEAYSVLLRKTTRMSMEKRKEIFGDDCSFIREVIENIHPKVAIEKYQAWKEKKAEEEAKLKIGDVVEVTVRNCTGVPPTYRGVVISDIEHSLLYMRKDGQTDCVMKGSNVTIKKTDKHVDILGVFEEE